MKLFQKYLKSNYLFYNKNNFPNEDNIILFLVSKDIYTTSLTMKFAKACSEVMKKNLCVVPNVVLTRKSRKVVESFYPHKTLDLKFRIFKIITLNFYKLFQLNKNLITGEDLLNLEIDGIKIGESLYDYLLARSKLLTIKKITLKLRLRVFIDIVYYLSAIDLLKKEKNPVIILPDNVYRHGAIFEYAKKHSIKSLAALSLTAFTIHKFDSPESYIEACRTPSKELVDKIMQNDFLEKKAMESFQNRIKGIGSQHDVVRAFAEKKIKISKEGLISELNLNPSKPIILVASHVFSDAPHANPGLLFKDYYEWLIETCLALKNNKEVNFLVKEHPSSVLYSETGKTLNVLKQLNLQNRMLPKNINTSSLFNSIHAVITCGGTAAMEFAHFGVPNLLASKCSYYDFGFSDCSETKTEYLNKILQVHKKKRLSFNQRKAALMLLFIFNEVQIIDDLDQIIGSQKTFLGIKKDVDLFMKEMIQDSKSGVGYKSLKENLSIFMSQRERNLISQKLIHNFFPEV